jgi:predicted alpha/beta-hydrolase family hydrolase
VKPTLPCAERFRDFKRSTTETSGAMFQPQPASPDKPMRVAIDAATSVSALLRVPKLARACYVLALGAGAGMTHAFMQEVSDGLAERQVASLRFQFPYVERGSKRPDAPAVAHAAVRAACVAAYEATGLPLFAGGKSFGGRMTSQAQAVTPLPHVHGLAFLGFPLHPPDKPSSERAHHLTGVRVPLLFIQGTRDKLAEHARMSQVVSDLGSGSVLLTIQHADHGFDVLVRSGRTHNDVLAELLDGMANWMNGVLEPRS